MPIRTLQALTDLSPSLLVPAHCNGFRALHQLTTHFPDELAISSVGTTITL